MSQLQNRQNVIKGIFIVVILILLIKLFYIQIINSEYKFSARNNAVRFEVQQAARGLIYDRNGELLVSNVASYDLMVIPKEVTEIDTLKLCDLSGMNLKEFRKKLKVAADYSNYKESVFSKQLNTTSAHRIQESLNIFNGFYVRVNTTRDYPVDVAAHAIGFLGEVDEEKIKDKYYTKGDLEGKTGIEASYEKQLRGEKGMKMVLVDAHNTSKGSFNNGMHDTLAIHGKNITSTLLRQDLSACIEQLNDTDFAITKHGKVIAVLTTLERFESSAGGVTPVSPVAPPVRPSTVDIDPYTMPAVDGYDSDDWSEGLDDEFENYLNGLAAG